MRYFKFMWFLWLRGDTLRFKHLNHKPFNTPNGLIHRTTHIAIRIVQAMWVVVVVFYLNVNTFSLRGLSGCRGRRRRRHLEYVVPFRIITMPGRPRSRDRVSPPRRTRLHDARDPKPHDTFSHMYMLYAYVPHIKRTHAREHTWLVHTQSRSQTLARAQSQIMCLNYVPMFFFRPSETSLLGIYFLLQSFYSNYRIKIRRSRIYGEGAHVWRNGEASITFNRFLLVGSPTSPHSSIL